MSYFGGLSFIQYKLQSFSHQEYNNAQYNNPDNILKAIESGKDLFGRLGSEELQIIEITDNDYLPTHYDMESSGTSKLVFKVINKSDITIEHAYIGYPANQTVLSCKTYPKKNGGMPEVNQTSRFITWNSLTIKKGKPRTFQV
jgi:hypothetical protein